MDFKYAEVVTPDDSNDLTVEPTKGLYVGGGGDVAVTLDCMDDENSVVLAGMNAGEIYPLNVKRVWSTNTTATDIVALY